MKFRKKSKIVEANQYDHPATAPIGVKTREDGSAYVTTIQGQDVNVKPGEWIVLEDPPGDGTRAYPVASDVFEANFELIADAANEHLAKQFKDSMANEVEGTRESLARCAKMLETYAPDLYPANEKGQVHFVRAMMESVADEIRAFLKLDPNTVCEHGVKDGEWCEACNKAMKEAAKENSND